MSIFYIVKFIVNSRKFMKYLGFKDFRKLINKSIFVV